MAIPRSVRSFFERQRVKYAVQAHYRTETLEEAADVAGIPYERVARAVMLKDDKGLAMAVLPLSHAVDFNQLARQFRRPLSLARRGDYATLFSDCAKGCVPPLGEAYHIETFIDSSLEGLDYICFEPGNRTNMVKMSGNDFANLFRKAWFGRFAFPIHYLADLDMEGIRASTNIQIRERIGEISELPAMPEMALQLLKLKNSRAAGAAELAGVIELDPSLSAQTLRYAGSALYGYRGKLESVHDAIARVLGFDAVMNMALGVAVGKSFRNPPDGPLGMEAYWQHAIYCAALCQNLSKRVSTQLKLRPGLAYLTGLLHNFGFLIMGHLFQPEFYLLNKLVSMHPHLPITVLENQLFAEVQDGEYQEMGHAFIGSLLLEHWKLPSEVVVTAREHHHPDYNGEHAAYAKLVMLANALLKRSGIGDAGDGNISLTLLRDLGISEESAVTAYEELIERGLHDLNLMASQMAA